LIAGSSAVDPLLRLQAQLDSSSIDD
jgi:hypothetical protein